MANQVGSLSHRMFVFAILAFHVAENFCPYSLQSLQKQNRINLGQYINYFSVSFLSRIEHKTYPFISSILCGLISPFK